MWTDSSTTLQWIRNSEQRQQIFVAHRVSEILENTQAAQWRHCPGEINPADDGTRGIPFADFRINCRWFTGPSFLLQPKENWPQQFQPASNTTDIGPTWDRHGTDIRRPRIPTQHQHGRAFEPRLFNNQRNFITADNRLQQILNMEETVKSDSIRLSRQHFLQGHPTTETTRRHTEQPSSTGHSTSQGLRS